MKLHDNLCCICAENTWFFVSNDDDCVAAERRVADICASHLDTSEYREGCFRTLRVDADRLLHSIGLLPAVSKWQMATGIAGAEERE